MLVNLQKVAHLIDNNSRGIYAQKCDADNESNTKIENTFSLLLDLLNSRVFLIIKLKAQVEENNTFA